MINISKRLIGIESDYLIEICDTQNENVINHHPYYEFANYYRKKRRSKKYIKIFGNLDDIDNTDDLAYILYTTAYDCIYKNLIIFAEEHAFNKRCNPTCNFKVFNYIMLNFKAKYA